MARAFEEMDATNGAVGEMHADPALTEPVPLSGDASRTRLEMTHGAALKASMILRGCFDRPWLRRFQATPALGRADGAAD